MAEAKVGKRVQVDISGIETPGISIGEGIVATGEILEIDPSGGEITVRLDLSFDGRDVVTVPVDRAELLPPADAAAARPESFPAH